MYNQYTFLQFGDTFIVTPKEWDPITFHYYDSSFTITGLSITSLRMGTTSMHLEVTGSVADTGDVYQQTLRLPSRPDLDGLIRIPDTEYAILMQRIQAVTNMINGDIRQQTRNNPDMITEFFKKHDLV